MLLKELWTIVAEEDKVSKKSKKAKNSKDKSADKFFSYVAGNTIMKQVCSGKLSGETTKD